jgi:benzoyl-CoA reductase subunit D
VITAGIDAGAENTKALIFRDDKVLAYSIIPQGLEATLPIAEKALAEAARSAGVLLSDIDYLVSTGISSEQVAFCSEYVSESAACARGASWLIPSTDTVIDIGADKCLVVKCQRGRPFKTARNDRCAAGTSRFLKIAAKPLGVDVEEMGRMALRSQVEIEIDSVCAVFAESEIISLIHQKQRSEDIAKAVFKGLANRVYTLIVKVGFEKDLVMVGGIAKNKGFIRVLEEKAGCNILIPDEPMIAGALGAAIIAYEKGMTTK